MKLFKLCILSIVLILGSCTNTKKKVEVKNIEIKSEPAFEYGVWTTASKDKSDEDYDKEFEKYESAGIDEILINTNTDPVLLKRIIPIAKKHGLKVHAWIMTMQRAGDSIALQHPEWYAVSREGKSCFDTRPYVEYYQWLCPTRKESREHVLGMVEALSKIDGIESVHLDYIRFSDIFLPIGLLPKYNLVQDVELAEFDFCYCDVCIAEFEKIHHKNPKESKNTAIDMEWKQFRLNRIKQVVDEAYEIVHKNGKNLTAAVFPYPEMADHMVRQRWDKWNIDEVYPMIYHGFYNEEIDWVGYATAQGVRDIKGTGIQLNTGVFLGSIKSSDEFRQAILEAKNNGAKGITFFSGEGLNDDHAAIINEMKAK